MVSVRVYCFFNTCILLSLASLWLEQADATTTLTVDLTTDIPGKPSVTVPEVCNVEFLFEDGSNMNETMCSSHTLTSCTYTRENGTSSVNFTIQKNSQPFTFTVIFDASMEVSCSSYIPHTHLDYIDNTTFTCDPVYACNSTTPLSLIEVNWWKFFSKSELNQFLSNTNKSGFSQYRLTQVNEPYEPYIDISDESDNTRINISGDHGQVLNVHKFSETSGNPGTEALGFYVPTFVFNGSSGEMNGQQFIVFMDAELVDASENKEIIFGSKRARNFDEIHCEVHSFPLATVEWTSPSGSNFSLRNVGKLRTDFFDLYRTLNGRLQFKSLQYEDGGIYRCRGRTQFSTTESDSIRLRVRDPLRPLWPALGIVFSFIITAAFIFGGAVVDKLRGKQGTSDDDGSFQRNYSVVSNLGDDSSQNAESRHTRKLFSKKRVSITQQQLLPDSI